jgi:hypothetical protein
MRRIASVVAATALVAAAGCGDNSSPAATAPSARNSAAVQDVVTQSIALSGNYQYSFNISAKGGVYLLGQYLLSVPANAVCDPSTSSYGPQFWDAPCTPARGSTHVTVTVSTVGGRDYVDFTPHLRFVPSDNQANWVTINTYRLAAIGGNGDLRRFSMLFADSAGAALVDESAVDSTLATHINTITGFVWRRVKHFTGYNIHTGEIDDCTPYVDDGCYPVGTIIVTP